MTSSHPRSATAARSAIAVLVGTALMLTLVGCVPNAPAEEGAVLDVASSASACDVSASEAPSGNVVFRVSNTGDEVTEFYLLADDGLRIVGEVENVGPGIDRNLVVQARPGDYFTVCKPGMVGEGVDKRAFTVTDSGYEFSTTDDEAELIATAETNYVSYIKDQVEQLVTGTDTFLEAYLAGDDDRARALYAITRASYERIEPVAESFGDLDPKLDFREADVEEGTEWTGWHRIEKDLWPPAANENGGTAYVPLTSEERKYFAALLTKDTASLNAAVHDSEYSVPIDAISNGAIGLLDEVASGKITGEEEIWSHTDLWDFQANLDGARVAYEGVRDLVKAKDAELVAELDAQFVSLQELLSQYGTLDDGFLYYTQLSADEIKDLADGVNALAEPLSRLTAAVVG